MVEISIIFEDADIVVLDKPSGIIVNESDTTIHEETIQEWVENKFSFLKFYNNETINILTNRIPEDKDSDFHKRSGIVHRIDKETSGVLLVAKNESTFIDLQRQFKERVIAKTYLALAHGLLEPSEGEINVPIGRLPWNRTHFGVIAGGRESVTNYKVLEIKYLDLGRKGEQLSLVEIYPKTGRTHQIRVHLKHLNHPIFSDPLYAGRKTMNQDRKLLSRMFLHAAKIQFYHPKTKAEVIFQSPLPKDLDQFLRSLKKKQ
ncbi:hypothetical protein LBMAG33_4010 [Candidatus Levyibacteriota bacterium]|nr:RluA family pseudouridine synthase [Candidatus Levybacteria bacterium]MSU25967.1 RluA family pseudouridine synthase [Candidatus Levybacteria bacterium]GDX62091.1 hypothetical protein LBMAG33_4010 [Candidatus Levybacteria bacterium]